MMDFMGNCDPLSIFISKKNDTLSIKTKLYVMTNAMQSLRLLHEKQVVHLDFTPNNILVCPSYLTKLIDFGESYHHSLC